MLYQFEIESGFGPSTEDPITVPVGFQTDTEVFAYVAGVLYGRINVHAVLYARELAQANDEKNPWHHIATLWNQDDGLDGVVNVNMIKPNGRDLQSAPPVLSGKRKMRFRGGTK